MHCCTQHHGFVSRNILIKYLRVYFDPFDGSWVLLVLSKKHIFLLFRVFHNQILYPRNIPLEVFGRILEP